MNLDYIFGALADPTRRAIVAQLAHGASSVSELAEPFNMSLPNVSKHIKVLELAELVSRHREAQTQQCRLEPETLKAVDSWLSEYRRLWSESLDKLHAYPATLKSKQKIRARRGK